MDAWRQNILLFVWTIVAVFVGLAAFEVLDFLADRRPIVQVDEWPCEEDEVIVGVGDYERGRWSAYVCRTADDLVLP